MARSIRFNESADAKQFNCFLYLQLLPLHRDPRLLRHWLFRHASSETDSHPCVSVILSPLVARSVEEVVDDLHAPRRVSLALRAVLSRGLSRLDRLCVGELWELTAAVRTNSTGVEAAAAPQPARSTLVFNSPL